MKSLIFGRVAQKAKRLGLLYFGVESPHAFADDSGIMGIPIDWALTVHLMMVINSHNKKKTKTKLELDAISFDHDDVFDDIKENKYSRYIIMASGNTPEKYREESRQGFLTGFFLARDLIRGCKKNSLTVPPITILVFEVLADRHKQLPFLPELEDAGIQIITYEELTTKSILS